jgi:branched-chain amino acid transport system ATP-binding protein
MTLLEVDSLDAYYGESHILRALSMEVESGTITALLGRNGAGKSTTLRAIAGAKPPQVRDGTIRFQGDDVTGMSPDDVAVRGISLVPEERRIFPDLTVAEHLHLSEVVRNKSNTIGRSVSFTEAGLSTDEIYDYFPRLEERVEQKAGTLSGGEQQMLAIGRALKQNADLLMLDEPYEGLAPQIIQTVEDAIAQIRADGTTILLVEQNAAAAITIADFCYVIDRGEIVFADEADVLREDDEVRQRYLGI